MIISLLILYNSLRWLLPDYRLARQQVLSPCLYAFSELLSRRASFDVSRSVPPCLYIYTWPRDGRDLDMNILVFFFRAVGLIISFALRLIWNQLLDIDCCFLTTLL